MDVNERVVLIFEREDGSVPFREWMDKLAGLKIWDIVQNRLERVEMGNLGRHKSVGEGVVELIIDYGPGYRIYVGQDGKDIVILLIGGDKKTQAADIVAAKMYWSEYNA